MKTLRLMVAAAVLAAMPVAAADAGPHPSPGTVPEAPARLHARPAPEALWARLAAHAVRDGTVRVIAGLDVPATAEGVLGDAAAAAQRRAIRSASAAAVAALPRGEHRVLHRYASIPYVALEVTPAGLDALRRAPGVNGASSDVLMRPHLQTSVPFVQADQAVAGGHDGRHQDGGSPWVVAVLDTGVDTTQPFFAGKVVAEACFSDAQCGMGRAEAVGRGTGRPCTEATGCDHGTHVAGIAVGRNTVGGGPAAGVAPGASLMSVRITSPTNADCDNNARSCPMARTSDIVRGLDHVFQLRGTHRFAAVNLSFGDGGRNTGTCDGWASGQIATKAAIDNLRSAGIATVVSSGNRAMHDNGTRTDPSDDYGFADGVAAPACVSSAVSVGNSLFDDTPNQRSQTASYLSLYAPGTGIVSAVPGGFAPKTGTSMAAPHVAGAWAMIRQLDDSLSVSQVLRALQDTGAIVYDNRNGISRVKRRMMVMQALNHLSLPADDGEFIRTPNDAKIYRVAGRAPLWVTDCAPLGGCAGWRNVPSLSDYRSRPLDGTYLGSSNGRVYRVAGGAALLLSDCAALAGCPGRIDVNVMTFETFDHLERDPAPGTVLMGVPSGNYWRIDGRVRTSAASTPAAVAVNDATLRGFRLPSLGNDAVTVWRPSSGDWWTYDRLSGRSEVVQWGLDGDVPFTGDFTGDGVHDRVVFRPSDLTWYRRDGLSHAMSHQAWGEPGDVPVPGDYDADGRIDYAVWRPRNGTWYVLRTSTGTLQWQQFGLNGDRPVPADYDADGRTDFAVFRPSDSGWYVLSSYTGVWRQPVGWGVPSDRMVPADYDGDGRADLAVWRPSTAQWWVVSSASGWSLPVVQHGLAGDVPAVGDYDGDGRAERAVWRPSNGTWYVPGLWTQQWGLNGDVPVAS